MGGPSVVELTGVKELLRGLDDAKSGFRQASLIGIRATLRKIRNNAVKKLQLNHIGFGDLANSIQVEKPEVRGDIVEGRVVVGKQHGLVVEFGRRAASVNEEGKKAIARWVWLNRAKFQDPTKGRPVTTQKRAQGLAFVIARKMAKVPRPPRPFMAPALDQEGRKLNEEITKAARGLLSRSA